MEVNSMLYVTRYGETDWNLYGKVQGKADIELNAKGIEQAKETMEKLKEESIDFIICSPLKRTKQTLEAIFPNQEFIKEKGFTEISLGDWEGLKKEKVNQKRRKAFQQGEYAPPHGERHEEVESRVKKSVERIFATYPDGAVILVCTSNGIMRTIKRMYNMQTKDIMSKNLEYVILKRPE